MRDVKHPSLRNSMLRDWCTTTCAQHYRRHKTCVSVWPKRKSCIHTRPREITLPTGWMVNRKTEGWLNCGYWRYCYAFNLYHWITRFFNICWFRIVVLGLVQNGFEEGYIYFPFPQFENFTIVTWNRSCFGRTGYFSEHTHCNFGQEWPLGLPLSSQLL